MQTIPRCIHDDSSKAGSINKAMETHFNFIHEWMTLNQLATYIAAIAVINKKAKEPAYIILAQ